MFLTQPRYYIAVHDRTMDRTLIVADGGNQRVRLCSTARPTRVA